MIGLVKAFFRAFFYRMPNVGDVYISDEKDPFNRVEWHVLDTKEGWVAYSTNKDDKRPISTSRSSFHFWNVKKKERNA